VDLTTHPHLPPRLKKEYSYTSFSLCSFMPGYRVNFYRYRNMSVRDTQILGDCWIENFSIRPNICGSLGCSFLQYYLSGIEFWGRLWIFGKFVDPCFKHPLRIEMFAIKFTDICEIIKTYVYWTVHHLDSRIKIDQLDVTCFFISLFIYCSTCFEC